ncbi:acetyltransferase [Methylobacillus flagellatus]|uniref:acetyltransferase n=1 Tax=Methylobacillus flagellatus TaxID=405 RepID=UPI002853EAE3|nr:acetyltransferase [Methylobacillus flagellatus]MDR5172025.1 acetyltransferase [Methylobacillus flagellatus]
MKKLYIIGAGGWGREVLILLRDHADCGSAWDIAGFLDTRPHMLDGTGCDVGIVGDPLTHLPKEDELFVCAVGLPNGRQSFAQPILEKGGRFFTLHDAPLGWISVRVQIGLGAILSHRVQVSPDVQIGDFANIHSGSIVSHDVRIGDYAQIGAMVFLGGGAQIGHKAIIYPHATITPGIKVGEGATVGAGAVVIKDVPPDATVFGNPAKVIF